MPAMPRRTRWTRLRKGADALAKQMQNGSNGNQDEGSEDPLGRGQNGPGNGIKLPDANDLARARDILQELRSRAGERGRRRRSWIISTGCCKEF